LSANGRYALSGGLDVRLWEVKNGRCLRTFNPGASVSSLGLSADGRLVLTGGSKALNLWEVHLGEQTPAAPFMLSQINVAHEVLSNQAVYNQALSDACRAIEDGDITGAARAIRSARSLPGFERAETALVIWRQLYIRLPHKSFRGAWNVAVFEGHTNHVTSVCLSVDGHYALSGSRDHTIKLWEIPG
jgi:WD40 repeat protein